MQHVIELGGTTKFNLSERSASSQWGSGIRFMLSCIQCTYLMVEIHGPRILTVYSVCLGQHTRFKLVGWCTVQALSLIHISSGGAHNERNLPQAIFYIKFLTKIIVFRVVKVYFSYSSQPYGVREVLGILSQVRLISCPVLTLFTRLPIVYSIHEARDHFDALIRITYY